MELRGKVKKLYPEVVLPTYGTPQAACVDLRAYCPDGPEIVEPGEVIMVHTGLAIEPPEGYMGLIFARSGMSSKFGLRLANSVGVIDEDYRGEYLIAIRNDSKVECAIENGTRIAQLTFVPYHQIILDEVPELSTTSRGGGGFGSTGTN